MHIVLGLLAALCCLVLPALLTSAPLMVVGVRGIRKQPERRPSWLVGISLANALISGTLLTVASGTLGLPLVGEGEGAGQTLGFLLSISCGGGVLCGFAITSVGLGLATRGVPAVAGQRAPQLAAAIDEPRLETRARRTFVAASLLLVLGVATSLTGLLVAFSLGMISLALAAVTVRPIAVSFALAHVLSLLLSVRVLGGGEKRRRMATAATAVSAFGVLVATLIAVFGPDFFDRLGRALAGTLGV